MELTLEQVNKQYILRERLNNLYGTNNLSIHELGWVAYNKAQDKILMPATYLNQNRFLDEWDLEQVTYDQKWVNTMLAEQVQDDSIMQAIIAEKRAWESKNPHRELTTGIFQNIINEYK